MKEHLHIKGVNLGNWLVLEKWMSPHMFDGTDAEDEYWLARDLQPDIYRERLTRHREEYVTERDFMAIAKMGFNSVRIPIPFFIFGDRKPYVGCIEYLDRAFDWAEKWNLKILIDLHTVPGSQNGFDNGGLCGVCKWAQMPEEIEFVLQLLEKLAQRYGGRPGLFGIQPLNEPITDGLVRGGASWEECGITKRYVPRDPEMMKGSAPVSMEFLRNFYEEAYGITMKYLNREQYFVIHDAFHMLAWKDFMQTPEFANVILDSHMYLSNLEISGCEKSPEGYQRGLADGYGKRIEEMKQYFPVICGEWCLDNQYAKGLQEGEERDSFYRKLAAAALDTWNKGDGYFYWSYKLITQEEGLESWDLGKCVLRGWLPERM